MDTLFDFRTVLLVGAFTTAIGLLTLIALERMYRPAASAIRWYAMAMAVMMLGLAGISFRGMIPPWLSYFGTNWLISIGAMMCWEGTRRLFGRAPSPLWRLGTLTALVTALWLGLGNDPGDVRPRMLALSLLQAIFFSAAALVAASSPEAGRQRYVRTLAVFFAGFCALHLIRAVMALAGSGPMSDGVMVPDPRFGGIGLLFALSPIVLVQIIQMMLHGRVAGDLHRRATTDELTGLNSRGHFFELAARRMEFERERGRRSFLLMIDLDHFKSVNDRFGHSVGDRALQHAARVLDRAVQPHGLMGRYGGEEFCALISTADASKAGRIIDSIRQTLEQRPFVAGLLKIPLTASIGAVPVDRPSSLERMLLHADQCVYQAKTTGRNRVVGFGDELTEPV